MSDSMQLAIAAGQRKKVRIIPDFFFVASEESKVGPSGATRTPGLLLPKQARYQLRNTRIKGVEFIITDFEWFCKGILAENNWVWYDSHVVNGQIRFEVGKL